MQTDENSNVGQKGRFYLTKHIWVPQEPIENFNLRMSDMILKRMPRLPLGGEAALTAFPVLGELKKSHDKIKADLRYLLSHHEEIPALHEVHPRDLFVPGRAWRTFLLKIWGHEITENTAAVPDTYEAISRIPGVHTALFSILAGGARDPLPLSADRAQGAGEVLDGGRRPPLLLGRRRTDRVRRHTRALGQEPDRRDAGGADHRFQRQDAVPGEPLHGPALQPDPPQRRGEGGQGARRHRRAAAQAGAGGLAGPDQHGKPHDDPGDRRPVLVLPDR